MIFKISFMIFFIFLLLRLVQREKLSLDLASLALILIGFVLFISFSPFWVERIASLLEFSNPAFAVVALVLVGLICLCMILAVTLSELKYRYSRLLRKLVLLELSLLELRKHNKDMNNQNINIESESFKD